jgi:hypothetical protein
LFSRSFSPQIANIKLEELSITTNWYREHSLNALINIFTSLKKFNFNFKDSHYIRYLSQRLTDALEIRSNTLEQLSLFGHSSGDIAWTQDGPRNSTLMTLKRFDRLKVLTIPINILVTRSGTDLSLSVNSTPGETPRQESMPMALTISPSSMRLWHQLPGSLQELHLRNALGSSVLWTEDNLLKSLMNGIEDIPVELPLLHILGINFLGPASLGRMKQTLKRLGEYEIVHEQGQELGEG